jgi:hypothetical protein
MLFETKLSSTIQNTCLSQFCTTATKMLRQLNDKEKGLFSSVWMFQSKIGHPHCFGPLVKAPDGNRNMWQRKLLNS